MPDRHPGRDPPKCGLVVGVDSRVPSEQSKVRRIVDCIRRLAVIVDNETGAARWDYSMMATRDRGSKSTACRSKRQTGRASSQNGGCNGLEWAIGEATLFDARDLRMFVEFDHLELGTVIETRLPEHFHRQQDQD